jgi:hypothetical protein
MEAKDVGSQSTAKPGEKLMARQCKQLLIAGTVILLIAGVLFGYACHEEAEVRSVVRRPEGVNFGFIPFDLLQGRTHFEQREGSRVVFSMNTGPLAEGRIAIARAVFGLGFLGVGLLILRAFIKESRGKTAVS